MRASVLGGGHCWFKVGKFRVWGLGGWDFGFKFEVWSQHWGFRGLCLRVWF